MIGFVLSNPRHHAEMMVPVVRELTRRGVPCRIVSLAELRGFTTPDLGVDVVRAIPGQVRKSPSAGASGPAGPGTPLRRVAQTVVWRAALGPRLRWLLHGARAVVVPNDGAFPYRELVSQLRGRDVPFVLMQEGIRFPLPHETGEDAYGRGGAAAICAWGEASAAHFRGIGATPDTVHVTGNPRFDSLDPAPWRERGQALLARLGLDRAPLLFLSNPIDDQGFCTTEDKLALFERFLDEARPALEASGRAVVVKLHPREDVAAFRAAAQRSSARDRTHVLGDEPLFSVLGAGHAAVVVASTVGLEALLFGLPLAVLQVPGHGFVFDYVSGGAAAGLAPGAIGAGVADLLARGPAERNTSYLMRHLAHVGTAAQRVADRIQAIGAAR